MPKPHPAAKIPTASEIETKIARLQKGHDHVLDTVWPHTKTPIRIRVLTRSERQLQFAAAWKRFVDLGIDLVTLDNREEFCVEQVTQVLALAIMDPSRPTPGARHMCAPMFVDADECRDSLTDDEQVWLWDAYLALERESNPGTGDGMTPEVIEQIREAQKKRAPDLLKGIAPSTLRSFIAITDALPSNSQSGKSGSGPLPEPPGSSE